MGKRHRRRVPRYQREPQAAVGKEWDPRFGNEAAYAHMMRDMPAGAIVADQTRHAYLDPYTAIFWYVDYEFTCVDCGRHEVWTAEQQRWWYEDAQGPLASKAIRCRACREAQRDAHRGTPRRSHRDRRAGENR